MLATGFIGMLLMAAFGVVLPTLHMSCEAVTNGIASPTAFDGLATALGLQSNITNILRECVPGGSGSLVKGMGSAGSTFQTSFGDIVSATQAASSVSTYSLS